MTKIIFSFFFTFACVASAEIIEFRIVKGTGSQAWNSPGQTLMLKVGDTLRIYNDDDVVHQLHTPGRPCSHGRSFAPGTSFDCVASKSYSLSRDGAIYDHGHGPKAPFYILVNE